MTTASSLGPSNRSAVSGCGRASAGQLLWSIAFAVSLVLATAALHRLTLPIAVRYLVPSVPLIAGFLYLRAMARDIQRQNDELQLRIYLEAAAIVVCGLFLVMLTYPLLQAAGVVGQLDYSIVMLLLVLLGAAGYLSAKRRYR